MIYSLPISVQKKIYMYDNTYRLVYDKVIYELNNISKKNTIKLEIVKEDYILFMCIAIVLIIVYIIEYYM